MLFHYGKSLRQRFFIKISGWFSFLIFSKTQIFWKVVDFKIITVSDKINGFIGWLQIGKREFQCIQELMENFAEFSMISSEHIFADMKTLKEYLFLISLVFRSNEIENKSSTFTVKKIKIQHLNEHLYHYFQKVMKNRKTEQFLSVCSH